MESNYHMSLETTNIEEKIITKYLLRLFSCYITEKMAQNALDVESKTVLERNHSLSVCWLT